MGRHYGLGVSIVVGLALVSGACGSEGSSSEGSVRTKNAALDVQAVACSPGGYGPAGGIVMKVGATTADQSIEVSRDWFTVGSGDPVAVLQSVNAFATDLSKRTKPGWFIPDQITLKANLSLLYAVKGQEFYWTSSLILNNSKVLGVWGVRGDSGRDSNVNSYDIYLYKAVAFRTFLEKDEPCTTPPTTTTVAPTTTTTTSTTLPPTTTTSSTTTTSTTTMAIRQNTTTARPTTTTTTVPLVPCSNLANCQVGERGPGGGIIIKRSGDSTAPRYLEIAPAGWNNGGRDALVSAADAPATASAYKGGGLTDWRLPYNYEIEDVCKFATGQIRASESYCPQPTWRIDSSFGDGTGRGWESFYWHGMAPIRERMDFATTRREMDTSGNAYVRPVRSWGYVGFVPPTTTTTIPKNCVEGGVCRIGDISPTGGLIVDFSGSGSAMTYTELAPKSWNGGTTDPILTKEAAQEAIRRYGVSANAAWSLPTDRQMRAAFVFFANNPMFAADCRAQFSSWRPLSIELQRFFYGGTAYWIAAQGRADKFDNFEIAHGAAYYDVRTPMSYSARPFAEQPYRGGGNPRPAQWSNARCEYQTIPTTTTTTIRVGCAGRGICRVGDVGRYGGIIIAVQLGRAPSDITYTEMQRATSKNFDCQGSDFLNSCVSGQYDNNVRTLGLNGVFDGYPTTNELRTVAASNDLKLKLAMRNDWYFSSTYRVSKSLTADMQAGSSSEMLSSLQINDQTVGVAINMGTRAQSELNYAFFRGVNRWKCEYSCIQN